MSRRRALYLILLIGAVIRLHALGQNVRFHPDEALFATFARHATLNGDWLLHGSLDKPPLAIYASALSMTLFGARVDNTILTFDYRVGEITARLPAVFAQILLVAVVYALTRRLYRGRTVAAWAALFAACSPVAVAFSATAFTDGLMLLLMTLALWAISRGSWLWSGIWLALAVASKQQALFYLPLVLALGWAVDGMSLRRCAQFAAPLGLGALVLIAWDAARAQETSFWTLAAANNAIDGLAADPGARLGAWTDLGRLLLGTPTFLLLGGAALAVISGVIRRPREQATVIDTVLALAVIAYIGAHVLINFNVYDRYLLPLVPLLAILGARGGVWLWGQISRISPRGEVAVIAAAIALALVVGGWNAAEGNVNVGGDGGNGRRGVYTGINELADFLNQQSLGAIIYDRWIGWELGYYLGEWTDKRKVYYPTIETLVAGALDQPDPAPRYLAAPVDQPIASWLDALREAGFTVTRVYNAQRFVVYELLPPPRL